MEFKNGPNSSVVFVDLSETFVPGKDIVCTFSILTELLTIINEKCWVGLFRVGWEVTDEFLSRMYLGKTFEKDDDQVSINLSLSEWTTAQVTFDASVIPSANDKEYFQFCFITDDGNILGASGPFLICASKVTAQLESLNSTGSSSTEFIARKFETDELDLCPWLEFSEEAGDALIVHSKTTLLEKSLAKVVGENTGLRESLEEKDAEIEKLRAELKDGQEKLAVQGAFIVNHKKQQDSTLSWIEDLQERLAGLEGDKRSYDEKIKQMTGIKAKLEEQNNELRGDMDLLTKDLQLARGKELQKVCQGYEDRLAESVKAINDLECAYREANECITELKLKHKEELAKMSKNFDDTLMQLNAQCSNFENVDAQRKELLREIEKMTHSFAEERRDLCDHIEHLEREAKKLAAKDSAELNELKRELHSYEVLIAEFEANARDLKLKLSTKCEELAKVKESLSDSQHKQDGELHECQMELRHAIGELEAVRGENSVLKEKCNGHNGARHALQVAYKHTQRQLSSLKEEHETLSQKYQSLSLESMIDDKDRVAKELKDQVEDLKLRLCIGANAYREKVLQCKILQKQLKSHCDHSGFRTGDELQVPENTKTKSAIESEPATNESGLNELKTIMARLQKEASVKDKTIQELQRTIKSSEDTYSKSLQAMTAELVSLKMDLRAKDDQIVSLQSNRMGTAPHNERKSSNAESANSERERSSVAASTNASECVPCHPSSSSNYKREIFYPPTYYPSDNDNFLPTHKTISRDVPLTHGVVPPAVFSTKEGSRLKHGHFASLSSARFCAPKANIGRDDAPSTNAMDSCPVCSMVFPFGTSEVTATNHVNLHFEGGSNSESQ